MNSAFGIDHGYDDISKAGIPGFSEMGAKIAQKVLSTTGPLGRSAGKNISAGKTPGMGGSLRRLTGQAQVKLGQGAKKLGTGMTAHPGLTGGLAAGGAVGGVGAAGGALAGRKRY